MTFLQNLIGYAVSLLLILIMDSVWLGFIQRNNWKSNVEGIQNQPLRIRYPYAILSYAILAIIPVYVAFNTSKFQFNFTKSLLNSFLIGFFVYSIYNTTNLSIFNNYNRKTALYDILWGTFMITVVSVIISYIYNMNKTGLKL